MNRPVQRLFGQAILALAGLCLAGPLLGQGVTRAEAVAIGESYVNHSWRSSAANVRHGSDAGGVDIQTPDKDGGSGSPAEDCWAVGAENTGVPYKWGGFDTLASFDEGIRQGKAAGDVYTAEKRRLGGRAVSASAVGIDCSGFISRCWKLSRKHSTSMLFGISESLASSRDLRPGDVMNTAEGHVFLFVRWLDDDRNTALFYEASPFSKTLASERKIAELETAGFTPLRYRKIRD